MRPALTSLLLIGFASAASAQSHIAPTEANTPAQELRTFKVPAGFEVQLVAAEPEIAKPIQIAFDAKGRLWATTSRHYPFAAAPGEKHTDKLFVLSDFGPDGHAKTVTTFADDLNIPLGVLPLPDGKSCILSEVGQIVKLTDTDGDGKADKREVLLSGFGTKDTHGMMNSFLLRPDGWVYACHGFSNESKVVGTDGSTITMVSGNTFRFRPDGTKVQHWTHGQVNPFGLAVDPWGNLYTADCHSKPITQLIPGSYYSSFGKPDDGLGFGPHVTRHDHGSTALCGLVWYEGGNFPAQFQGAMFLGNVVTNRINADHIVWTGSTPVAEELPDLVASSDPWFRPTDLKVGPDGAVYFADFYNRVIGHYEVDLKHPARDKDRGRIWRVVSTGKPVVAPNANPFAAEATALRTEANDPATAAVATAKALKLLAHENPHLRRAAVEVVGLHPSPAAMTGLLDVLAKCPADDTHLKHAARVALRNCLASPGGWAATRKFGPGQYAAQLTDAAAGIATKEAARFLVFHVMAGRPEPRFCEAIGRHGDDDMAGMIVPSLMYVARPVPALKALVQGVQSRGGALPKDAFAQIERKCDEGLAGDDAQAQQSTDLAANLKLAGTFAALVKLTTQPARPEPLRAAAFQAMLTIDAAKATPVLAATLADAAATPSLRVHMASLLAGANSPATREPVLKALQTAPAQLAAGIAECLARTPQGADALLTAMKAGKASPRLLQERAVLGKLNDLDGGKFKPLVAELTQGLPSADAKTAQLMRERQAGYLAAKPSVEKGKAVYATHCANCHQLGGAGAKVGPQLDGVGNRGLDRLLEDTLDPSRNVDAEFRTTVVNLADGRVLSGLALRQEGQTLVMADNLGKEVRINAADIDKRGTSPLSPMPANFDTALKPEEYYDLLAYLLEQRVK